MPTRKRHQPESERKKSADERGRLLREFRKVYDVTLEDMAQRVGLSQPMLTRFETGTRNLSTDAWTRLFIAMGEIEKEKGAAIKARFDELQKQWLKSLSPNLENPFALFALPPIEAETHRIVDRAQSRLEVLNSYSLQLPKVQAVVKKKALAYIRKNPGRTLERYSSLEQRIAELEQQLKACQEELTRRTSASAGQNES